MLMKAEEDDETWEQQWREMLQHAATRPTVYIGSQEHGHHFAISNVLRLVRKEALAFSDPTHITIMLAPTQYVVRCESGPLLSAIEKLITWRGERLLQDELRDIGAKIMEGRKNRPLQGWRYAFTGPIGPRLDSPTYPLVFSPLLAYGIRTRAGLRCQVFEAGWPTSKPFLIVDPSPVGLITAASLDPAYFTGLPFGADEVEGLSRLPNVSVEWHPENNLLDDFSPSPEGIRRWL